MNYINDLMNKTLQLDVLVHNGFEDWYIPCEGYLVSNKISKLGYRVKVTKVIGAGTPEYIKKRLLKSKYTYVSQKEVEEYSEVIG